MAETKTKPTGANVNAYLESRGTPDQIKDCKAVMAICKRVTGEKPYMWGPSIVGYGTYSYTYESGHSGQAPLVGFAIRQREIVIYLSMDSADQKAKLERLGKHRIGKSCLYFKRLADLDVEVLESLLTAK